MSVWTHVAGIVRIDALKGFPGMDDQELDIGNPVQWEDPEEKWDACDIPKGSEGSLHVEVWTNPSDSSLARYTISVFGDLRDYDNVDEVVEYFNRLAKNGFGVRQGCFEVFVEGPAEPVVYQYRLEKESFVRVI